VRHCDSQLRLEASLAVQGPRNSELESRSEPSSTVTRLSSGSFTYANNKLSNAFHYLLASAAVQPRRGRRLGDQPDSEIAVVPHSGCCQWPPRLEDSHGALRDELHNLSNRTFQAATGSNTCCHLSSHRRLSAEWEWPSSTRTRNSSTTTSRGAGETAATPVDAPSASGSAAFPPPVYRCRKVPAT